MTHAERQLLLAVAGYFKDAATENFCPTYAHQIGSLIAAVEAEAVPEAPAEAKSCETCRFDINICGYGACIPGCGWQHKPTEADVCPMCDGTGLHELLNMYEDCPKCTGKQEKK